VPLPDPNNPGFFILSGENRIRGFETELRGYINDRWQSWLGYAYTDARVSSDTSPTIRKGNRIQLVPFHQFSWWNKYQIDPVWSASLGAVSSRIRTRRPTIPSTCRASCASTPASTRRSTRPGRRCSLSRTSSTRAIGLRPTATTTSRRVNRGPFASRSRRICEDAGRADGFTHWLRWLEGRSRPEPPVA